MTNFLRCDGGAHYYDDYPEFISLTKYSTTVTISIIANAIVTVPNHSNTFSHGDMCYFTTTGTLPTGINEYTPYIISNVSTT